MKKVTAILTTNAYVQYMVGLQTVKVGKIEKLSRSGCRISGQKADGGGGQQGANSGLSKNPFREVG